MSDAGWTGVRVPATSANLGPGFDCLGLALGLYDEVEVRPAGQTRVAVRGEGADVVPRNENHLILRAIRATMDELAYRPPAGLALRATNRVPHSRGLGSSAAAITAGVLAALHLAGHGPDAELALQVACRLEGHPDNVAACLRGGLTISWYEGTPGVGPHVVRLDPHPGLRPVVFIASGQSSTAASRMALPASVAHRDAAFNAARSALLVHALTQAPDLLVAATEDRLHQPYRLPGMPESARLLARLRAAGIPAVLSGSGPTVLALTRSGGERDLALRLVERDCGDAAYRAVALPVDGTGAVVRGG